MTNSLLNSFEKNQVSKILLSSAFFFPIVFYFIIPGVSSSFFLMLIISMTFSHLFYKDAFYLCKNKEVITVFLLYIVTPLYSAYVTIFTDSYDFSFLRLYWIALIYYLCLIFIASFYHRVFRGKQLFRNLALTIFVICFIQSSIISIAIVIPDFREVLSSFQDPVDVEIAKLAGIQIRGFALATQQFFGLSISFCLLFVFMAFFISNGHSSYVLISIMLFSFLMSITAGRTVFLGVIFAIIFILLVSISKKKFGPVFKIIVLFTVSFTISLLYVDFSSVERIINWAFELFINFSNGNGFESSSTNELVNDMLFMPEAKTLIFGDGIYTLPDGSYYLGTDSGYMRTLLMAGVSSVFLIFFDVYLFLCISRKLKTAGFRHTGLLFGTLSSMTLVLQIKGEVLGSNVMYHLLPLFILFVTTLHLNKITTTSENDV